MTGPLPHGPVSYRARTMAGVTAHPTGTPTGQQAAGGVPVGRVRAAVAAAAGWYRDRLVVDRPRAVLELLASRGLADLGGDTAIGRRWRAGHAPTGGHALATALHGQGFTEAELLAAGLAVPARHGTGVIDALRGRLVIPLVDAGGPVGFTARRLVDTHPGVPKWVNTATTVLGRKGEHLLGLAQQAEALQAGRGSVVLVEGAVDAVAVDAAGHIGLAAGGTRLTPAHAAQLIAAAQRCSGPLLVAYDPDPAGAAATGRAATLLPGVDAAAVQLPAGCDPADLLTATGPRGLRRALARTRPLAEQAVRHRLARWDRHTGNPVALVDAVHDVADLVLAAPAAHRARLVAVVAELTGLPAATVTGALLDDTGR